MTKTVASHLSEWVSLNSYGENHGKEKILNMVVGLNSLRQTFTCFICFFFVIAFVMASRSKVEFQSSHVCNQSQLGQTHRYETPQNTGSDKNFEKRHLLIGANFIRV